jgi:hypothetical protein
MIKRYLELICNFLQRETYQFLLKKRLIKRFARKSENRNFNSEALTKSRHAGTSKEIVLCTYTISLV